MTSLRRRCRQAEIQDQPDLDTRFLHQALAGLEHINFWSRAAHVLWPSIRDLAAVSTAPVSILDIATGAGDIPITLWRLARRHDLDLRLAGCDLNPRAIAFARHQARKHQADVRFFSFDAVQEKIAEKYDIVMCSLFLHHLSDEQAVFLLGSMAEAATQLLLVSDLVRNPAGLALAYFGTRFLIHSPVNRVDSVRSVRAAFTIEEARELARQAGLAGATLKRKWPCRFLLTWRKAMPNLATLARAYEAQGQPARAKEYAARAMAKRAENES